MLSIRSRGVAVLLIAALITNSVQASTIHALSFVDPTNNYRYDFVLNQAVTPYLEWVGPTHIAQRSTAKDRKNLLHVIHNLLWFVGPSRHWGGIRDQGHVAQTKSELSFVAAGKQVTYIRIIDEIFGTRGSTRRKVTIGIAILAITGIAVFTLGHFFEMASAGSGTAMAALPFLTTPESIIKLMDDQGSIRTFNITGPANYGNIIIQEQENQYFANELGHTGKEIMGTTLLSMDKGPQLLYRDPYFGEMIFDREFHDASAQVSVYVWHNRFREDLGADRIRREGLGVLFRNAPLPQLIAILQQSQAQGADWNNIYINARDGSGEMSTTSLTPVFQWAKSRHFPNSSNPYTSHVFAVFAPGSNDDQTTGFLPLVRIGPEVDTLIARYNAEAQGAGKSLEYLARPTTPITFRQVLLMKDDHEAEILSRANPRNRDEALRIIGRPEEEQQDWERSALKELLLQKPDPNDDALPSPNLLAEQAHKNLEIEEILSALESVGEGATEGNWFQRRFSYQVEERLATLRPLIRNLDDLPLRVKISRVSLSLLEKLRPWDGFTTGLTQWRLIEILGDARVADPETKRVLLNIFNNDWRSTKGMEASVNARYVFYATWALGKIFGETVFADLHTYTSHQILYNNLRCYPMGVIAGAIMGLGEIRTRAALQEIFRLLTFENISRYYLAKNPPAEASLYYGIMTNFFPAQFAAHALARSDPAVVREALNALDDPSLISLLNHYHLQIHHHENPQETGYVGQDLPFNEYSFKVILPYLSSDRVMQIAPSLPVEVLADILRFAPYGLKADMREKLSQRPATIVDTTEQARWDSIEKLVPGYVHWNVSDLRRKGKALEEVSRRDEPVDLDADVGYSNAERPKIPFHAGIFIANLSNDESSLPAFVKSAVDSPLPDERYKAVEVIGSLGVAWPLEYLSDLFDETTDLRLKSLCLNAMTSIGHSHLDSFLRSQGRGADRGIQVKIAVKLAGLGDRTATEALLRMLETSMDLGLDEWGEPITSNHIASLLWDIFLPKAKYGVRSSSDDKGWGRSAVERLVTFTIGEIQKEPKRANAKIVEIYGFHMYEYRWQVMINDFMNFYYFSRLTAIPAGMARRIISAFFPEDHDYLFFITSLLYSMRYHPHLRNLLLNSPRTKAILTRMRQYRGSQEQFAETLASPRMNNHLLIAA